MAGTHLSILDFAHAGCLGGDEGPRREACFRAVLSELNPVGIAETLLARDIANLIVQLLRDEQRLDHLEIQVQLAMRSIVAPAGAALVPLGEAPANVEFFAADRLETLARANLRRSNTLFLRLRQFRDLQRDRETTQTPFGDRDPRFVSELQCIAYLARRFQLGIRGCRRCGPAGKGAWLAVRQCWDCSACHTQTCIRHGTVMERSHVPLALWFHAIGTVLFSPTITAAGLSGGIGMQRAATAAGMLRKVRAAMSADEASSLLAGLDTMYLPTP